MLVLFVENKADTNPATSKPEFSLRATRGMLSAGRYRTLCFAGAALSVMTVSDGFLYLALQRRFEFHAIYIPLLFVGTALSYMLLAVPMGRLADRIGRAPVFIGGYLLLLLAYTALVVPELGPHTVPVYLLLLGGVLRRDRWRLRSARERRAAGRGSDHRPCRPVHDHGARRARLGARLRGPLDAGGRPGGSAGLHGRARSRDARRRGDVLAPGRVVSKRALAFVLLLSLCVLAGGAAVVVAALRGGSVNADASVLTGDVDVLPSTSRILVRGVDPSSRDSTA